MFLFEFSLIFYGKSIIFTLCLILIVLKIEKLFGFIKIFDKFTTGEAKNLQSRNHGSTLQRDVYCTVSLDQEEIFRTTTMEKTLK